jgi:hypothetical protein
MLTAPEAAASMSAFLNERVANLSRAMGGDDAGLRAALIVSSILGLTIARHFLKPDAFTRASDTDIARVARPWVTTRSRPRLRVISRDTRQGQLSPIRGLPRKTTSRPVMDPRATDTSAAGGC